MSKMSELFAAMQQAQTLMGGDEPPLKKICIDCVHCEMIVEHTSLTLTHRKYLCNNPKLVFIDPVDGSSYKEFCRIHRDDDGRCKPEALYWETKYGTA